MSALPSSAGCHAPGRLPIRDTLRHELTWSHYRRLISVENEQARIWYMNEAADSVWSTRQMDRQISTLYYERLLASKDKAPVVAEAKRMNTEVKKQHYVWRYYLNPWKKNLKEKKIWVHPTFRVIK